MYNFQVFSDFCVFCIITLGSARSQKTFLDKQSETCQKSCSPKKSTDLRRKVDFSQSTNSPLNSTFSAHLCIISKYFQTFVFFLYYHIGLCEISEKLSFEERLYQLIRWGKSSEGRVKVPKQCAMRNGTYFAIRVEIILSEWARDTGVVEPYSCRRKFFGSKVMWWTYCFGYALFVRMSVQEVTRSALHLTLSRNWIYDTSVILALAH